MWLYTVIYLAELNSRSVLVHFARTKLSELVVFCHYKRKNLLHYHILMICL